MTSSQLGYVHPRMSPPMYCQSIKIPYWFSWPNIFDKDSQSRILQFDCLLSFCCKYFYENADTIIHRNIIHAFISCLDDRRQKWNSKYRNAAFYFPQIKYLRVSGAISSGMRYSSYMFCVAYYVSCISWAVEPPFICHTQFYKVY